MFSFSQIWTLKTNKSMNFSEHIEDCSIQIDSKGLGDRVTLQESPFIFSQVFKFNETLNNC